MNISVCITVLNEEKSIGSLLNSLLRQTKKASEIIIVDGGSTDRTIEIINHYQKRFSGIKLLKEKCSRAEGRNLGVEVAKNEIIAITDAGCIARIDWLEKISHLLGVKNCDVAAGFYKMIAKNYKQKAMRIFLGVLPNKFDNSFLPSTRSIAFRKKAWEIVGGFPEDLQGAAEDTVFNYRLVENQSKISRVKDAIVEWGMPVSVMDFAYKIYEYAKGDAKTKIWLFPKKGLASHNIHSLLIVFRSLLFVIFLVLSFKYFVFFALSLICIFAYSIFAYRKAGLWGMLLQIVADVAVIIAVIRSIIGFTNGLFSDSFQGN